MVRPRRNVWRDEVNNVLGIPSESEDDLDVSDSDSLGDESYVPSAAEDIESDEDVNNPPEVELDDGTRPRASTKPSGKKKTSLIWKKTNLNIPQCQLQFNGDSDLSLNILALDTPYQFFRYFFHDGLLEIITEETHRFSVQVDPSKPFTITTDELKRFLGICIIMSLVHVPNARNYWGGILKNECIINTMPVNKFEAIRKNLHFNDNCTQLPTNHPDHDRIHKIRPIIDSFRKSSLSIPMEECLSLDEQMCATKARHLIKQYMPNKPHKWGYKIYVLSGISGFAYDFEVYTGLENQDSGRLPDEPDIGASSNVVVRLSRNIPRNKNHKLYFDNYFTSLPLMTYLQEKRGIFSLGTVRRNRIPDCKLPTPDQFKKLPRGTSEERVVSINGIDISNVSWKDNKVVMMLSTLAGKFPLHKVERYDKKAKAKVAIDCPNIIKEYNKHMGGVDLLDSIIGRYKNIMRSKKWYFRLFYHFLDLAVVNAWLLYRRAKDSEKSSTMKLADFRIEIAECLCKSGTQTMPKRGRPSLEVETGIQAKKQKGPTARLPPKDVRLDQIGHWPGWMAKRQRCKLPNCKGFTFVSCKKCGAALCLNKNNNCFELFHIHK